MFSKSLLIRVSELYYMQQISQSDIAKIINVSRATVSRILEQARNEGIVLISIQSEIAKNEQLSEDLRITFGLRDAIVIKDYEDYGSSQSLLGKAVSEYVVALSNNTTSIGISWGTNVRQFVLHMPDQLNLDESLVVQLHGSFGGTNPNIDGYNLVHTLSKKMGGKEKLLSAPGYVSQKAFKDELCQLKQIQNVLEAGEKVDIVVNGLGHLSTKNNSLLSVGYFTKNDIEALTKEDVVGQLLGRLYTINGTEIMQNGLYPISISLEALRKIPFSIGMAVSKDRSKAAYGAIIAKYINVLFCDESLALALLQLYREKN